MSISDSYVLCKEPNRGPIENYVNLSKVENSMDDNIKSIVEIAARRTVTGIVEETVEKVFNVGYNDQKKGINVPITNMAEEFRYEYSNKGV